jgi:hypothetical protein
MTHTAKHTPGPWVINANGDITSPHGAICWLPSGIANKQANTTLLAAAPAMYEALQATLAYFMRSNQSHAPEVQAIRTALAQAEGCKI